MTLELLNLELELMEPWAAAGSFVATAESSVPEVQRRGAAHRARPAAAADLVGADGAVRAAAIGGQRA